MQVLRLHRLHPTSFLFAFHNFHFLLSGGCSDSLTCPAAGRIFRAEGLQRRQTHVVNEEFLPCDHENMLSLFLHFTDLSGMLLHSQKC